MEFVMWLFGSLVVLGAAFTVTEIVKRRSK